MDADDVRAWLGRLTAQAQESFHGLGAQVRRCVAPLLAAWWRVAIERWERVRAYLHSHPDLVEVDAWLDRWYSFGTA